MRCESYVTALAGSIAETAPHCKPDCRPGCAFEYEENFFYNSKRQKWRHRYLIGTKAYLPLLMLAKCGLSFSPVHYHNEL